MSKSLTFFVDGACSGNPGPAGIGVVVKDGEQIVKEISEYIGEGTNNIAEYTALITALQEALVLKAENVKVFTDSELAYKQLIGEYKVKDEKIKKLFSQVKRLVEGLKTFDVQHVPREKNADADKLARSGIKKGQTDTVASLLKTSEEESPSS